MVRELGGRVCVRSRRGIVATWMLSLLALTAAGTTAQAQVPDALPFSKGFLISGNYVVG